MRLEKDALGPVEVPDDVYFGAQTQRARENFKVGSDLFPPQFIRAHGVVKRAAARVNCDMGLLDCRLADAIIQAADEVISCKFHQHFPLVIWQSGSGTQFNMNMNEVIANRAIELLGGQIGTKSPVHPNDHVNMSQSTNDTIPTSIHISAATALVEHLLPRLRELQSSFELKAELFKSIVKIGRTHLQDATPLTLGQEFSGYAAQIARAYQVVSRSLEHLYELPIGGTAVGTGLNTPLGFDEKMAQEIARNTGLPFQAVDNKYALMAAHDAVVAASGALKTLAAALFKIANDIRFLGSGPRSGLGELVLPANEPGSSIMPGKVNPTQCEMLSMIVCQVYGFDAAISMAGSLGNFELNVYKPLFAYNIIKSIMLLAEGIKSFNDRCVIGIEADHQRIRELLNSSLMLVTALNKHIGYDKSAEIALKAWREGLTLRQAALELGHVTAEEFDQWVQPEQMTRPG